MPTTFLLYRSRSRSIDLDLVCSSPSYDLKFSCSTRSGLEWRGSGWIWLRNPRPRPAKWAMKCTRRSRPPNSSTSPSQTALVQTTAPGSAPALVSSRLNNSYRLGFSILFTLAKDFFAPGYLPFSRCNFI